MIRLRQIGLTRWLRRRWYQVQKISANGKIEWSLLTDDPVLKIDPILGVGDAHAVVYGANEAWELGNPQWQTLWGDYDQSRHR